MNRIPSQHVVENWFRAGKKEGKKLGAKKENKRIRKFLKVVYLEEVARGNESLASGIDFAINVIWSNNQARKRK